MIRRSHKISKWIALTVIAPLVLSMIVSVTIIRYTQQPDQINISISNQGAYVQNLTVSCYGCSTNKPGDYDTWMGTLSFLGVTINVGNTTTESTGVSLFYALVVAQKNSLPCPSQLQTNAGTFCVLSVGPVPFSLHFDIVKTSTGGALRAIVYLSNGNWFPFNTTSGSLNKNMKFQSV